MSLLLGELDRVLGTVRRRQAGVLLLAGRHNALAEHLPVAFVVVTEKAGRKVVTAAVSLAAAGVNPHPHWSIHLSVRRRWVKIVS
jgi:hypothetical protein